MLTVAESSQLISGLHASAARYRNTRAAIPKRAPPLRLAKTTGECGWRGRREPKGEREAEWSRTPKEIGVKAYGREKRSDPDPGLRPQRPKSGRGSARGAVDRRPIRK